MADEDDLTYEDIDDSETGAGEGEEKDDYEDEEEVEEQLDNDEISPTEAGFQEGANRD